MGHCAVRKQRVLATFIGSRHLLYTCHHAHVVSLLAQHQERFWDIPLREQKESTRPTLQPVAIVVSLIAFALLTHRPVLWSGLWGFA